MITTIEDIDKINIKQTHYHPESYLKKYIFSKEILLDVFCSEYMIYCYEDYYYNDISINMIEKYQPHIDIVEFNKLWDDLDEIRIAELFSDYIINYPIKSLYKYNLIDKYILNNNFDDITIIYINTMKNNKFVQKHISYNNIYLSKFDNSNNLISYANHILKHIPEKYSSILPL